MSELNLYKKLHPNIPGKYNQEFTQSIVEINIFRLKLICLFLLILGSVLFFIDYKTLNVQDQPEYHHWYLWSDTLLFLFGLIYIPILLLLQKLKSEKQWLQKIVIWVMFITLISWSGAVGALEYFTHNSVSTIIVGMLISAIVLYLNGWVVFVSYTLTISIFIVCKINLSSEPIGFFTDHINLFGICLFCWLVSRILFINKVENFLSQHKISEKNDQLFSEILVRKKAEKELISSQKVLESKVLDRTQELLSVNVELKNEMAERKKMADSLQQARKMESIGTLAGGIAHDFNNILFPIIGHAELLIGDIPKDSPYQLSINEIYSGALRARALVKQILMFSRQESHEQKLMKIQVIVKEALNLIRSSIPATIDMKLDIDDDCGIIKADPTQIHQIIMNLATNAYHAMQETGGELKVSLREIELHQKDVIDQDIIPGSYICLIVSDTGIGMDHDLKQKIFDPFYTTKEQGKGSGMGLSVVHGIVKGIGGTIIVDSEPGKGSKFKVYFPKEEGAFEELGVQAKVDFQKGSERILLVDDEESVIIIVREILQRLGYQVTTYNDSNNALAFFRKEPERFDMVITDMEMPGLTGDKLSAELVQIRPGIPILLCTGFSEAISEQKATTLGIKGFLMKPIVIKDLSEKIREVLDDIE